ncbi:uncharacterized protein LOC123256957 [Drosophila ananassae]|nr:uncharacterized protein LOC123256957 [Drosophila ananassae]
MSTASLTFYMISLFFICAVSLNAGMPTRRSISELSLQEREELYRQTPPVPDERLADAELDSAYDTFNLRPRKPTENPRRI